MTLLVFLAAPTGTGLIPPDPQCLAARDVKRRLGHLGGRGFSLGFLWHRLLTVLGGSVPNRLTRSAQKSKSRVALCGQR